MRHINVRWLRTRNMSVLGACWKKAKVERKAILGKKECTREAIAGRKRITRACMEDLRMLGLGFFQYIVMDGKIETYTYRYLGIIKRG